MSAGVKMLLYKNRETTYQSIGAGLDSFDLSQKMRGALQAPRTSELHGSKWIACVGAGPGGLEIAIVGVNEEGDVVDGEPWMLAAWRDSFSTQLASRNQPNAK